MLDRNPGSGVLVKLHSSQETVSQSTHLLSIYWNWTELGRSSHLTGSFLNIPPSEYKLGLGEVKKKKKIALILKI